jgi:hypothetical protein
MTDMTWITWIPLFGVLVAGGFAILGAWISQRSAAAVAKQTLEGQRAIARDAALRDHRKQQIAPYLEAAKQRFRIWTDSYAEVGVGDRAKLLELQEKMQDPKFNSLIVTYVEIPDNAFKIAFQKFVNAEGELKSPSAKTEIIDKIKQMQLALIELSTASEHYLFVS